MIDCQLSAIGLFTLAVRKRDPKFNAQVLQPDIRNIITLEGQDDICSVESSSLVGADELAKAVHCVEALRAAGARTIDQVRPFVLER